MNRWASINSKRLFGFLQIALMLMVFLCSLKAMAALTAEIKPQSISYGDTFNLILTSDEKQNQLPNLKPLQADFHIVGTERTMSYTIVNGQARSIQQFIILLMPKKPGTLEVPSLKVGSEKTQTLSIDVADGTLQSNSPAKAATSAEDTLMLKTSVSKEKSYVGEEIIYSVRLYNSGRLMDAEYSPPQVENAVLISLGDTDRYQTAENGQTYVVEEQRYAVFPQKSGELKIKGPSFNALVYDAVPRQVQLPSESTTIQVSPIPDDFKGKNWLPAQKLELNDTFEKSGKITQGETITRIIELKALGIPAQLLPGLDFESTKEFSTYPEKPELKNTIQHNDLVGHATIKIIYLMNQPGKVLIPEFKMQWFNTQTGQTEIATLPEKVLQVAPGEEKSIKTPGTPVQVSPDLSNEQPQLKSYEMEKQMTGNDFPLAWILAAIFGVAWILTLLTLWYRPLHVAGSKRRRAIKNIHEACINNDPNKTREALLIWAGLRWSEDEFVDLNDVAKKVPDAKFKKELQLLSKAIFSPDGNNQWSGSELWIALASYRRLKPRKKRKNGDLPPINP